MIRLRLPALRERREDIPLLASHFLAKSARELGVEAKRLSDAALKYLAAQDWPGNVRQLENLCHWLTVMAPRSDVDVNDLPPELRAEQRALAGAELDRGARARGGDRCSTAARPASSTSSRASSRGADPEGARAHRRAAHRGGASARASGRNTLTRKIQELGMEWPNRPRQTAPISSTH